MHCNHPCLGVRHVEEGLDDIFRRNSTIVEIQVEEVEATLLKVRPVVCVCFVQPANCRHVSLLEDLEVVVRLERVKPRCNQLPLRRWPLEGNELWAQLMQIPVQRVLPILVLLQVEISHSVPPKLHRLVEGFEAVEEADCVCRRAVGCVTESLPGSWLNERKGTPGLCGRQSMKQHHVASQQVRGVRPNGRVLICVVNHRPTLQSRVRVLAVHELAETVKYSKIHGPKICTE
mmetsp:Transcript_67917/g.167729  ORF Transcript_67917/g.167729 Transcript_67917/m.167729 type:complete len:232 (-) Transcript_67917:895-1590(-)